MEYFKAEFEEWSSHSKFCQMFVHALEEIEKLQTYSMILLAISGKKRVWHLLIRAIYQQVKEGILVDDSRNWNLLEAGDLMFFGYYKDDKLRIDHVSIWLGDGYFIQSSKNVFSLN